MAPLKATEDTLLLRRVRHSRASKTESSSVSNAILRLPHQHYATCKQGDVCWPALPHRKRLTSVFGRPWAPLIVHFYVAHWPEIVALGDGEDGEEAVRDLREALRYEFDHLQAQHVIPCLCRFGWFNPPEAALSGGGSVGGRSFSDIVPSIETAYEALPLIWQGRTKVSLMMQGLGEEEVYRMRERPERRAESPFDKEHLERVRTESRRPGFKPRPWDNDDESESVWRRLARELGWVPYEERITPDVLEIYTQEEAA